MGTMTTEFIFVLVFLLTLRMDWAYRYGMDLQTCVDNFDVERDKIIRTVDSTSRGAVNLGFKDVSSREECLRICCETDLCDVFVFEEKMPGTCYTFQCGPPSESKCRFSKHRNYTVGMLAVDRSLSEQENQMKHEQDLVNLRQGVESVSSATTQTASIPIFPAAHNVVSSTTMSPSLAIAPVQQSQQEIATNLKLQQSETSLQQSHGLVPHSQEAGQPGRRCSRFQFECRSTSECIAIYNACDGIPQCPDGSDEAPECPTTALAAAQQAGIVSVAQQTALAQSPQSQQAQVAAETNSQPHQVAPPNEWLVRGAPQQILETSDRHQMGSQSAAGSHHNTNELLQQQHEEILHQQLIQQRVAPQQQQQLFQQQQQQLLQQQMSQQPIHPRQRPLEEVKSLLGAENRAYGSRNEADQSRHIMPHSGTSMQRKEIAWAGQDTSRGSLSYQAQSQQQLKMEQPPQVRNHQQGVLTDSVRPVVQQQPLARPNAASSYYNSPVADNQQRLPGQEPMRPIAPAGRTPYGPDYYDEDNSSQYNKMGAQPYANQGQQTQLPQKNLLSGARLQADLASVSYDNRPRMSLMENGSPQYIPQQVPGRPPGLSPLEQNPVQQMVPVQTQNQEVAPVQPQPQLPAPPRNPNQTLPVGGSVNPASTPVQSQASSKKEPVIPSYAKERVPEVNLAADALVADGETSTPRGAVISLSLGLSITGIMLALVGCRMRDVKRRLLRRSGKGSFVHEADADFLVNGMYL